MNSKIIRIIGLAATVIGLGANLINDWADEQKMNEQIDKKVNEALAKRYIKCRRGRSSRPARSAGPTDF